MEMDLGTLLRNVLLLDLLVKVYYCHIINNFSLLNYLKATTPPSLARQVSAERLANEEYEQKIKQLREKEKERSEINMRGKNRRSYSMNALQQQPKRGNVQNPNSNSNSNSNSTSNLRNNFARGNSVNNVRHSRGNSRNNVRQNSRNFGGNNSRNSSKRDLRDLPWYAYNWA